MVLLRSLADRLKSFESFESLKRGDVVSVDEDRLRQLAEQLASSEEQLKNLREDAEESEREKIQFRAEQQSLVERMTSSGGGGGDIATVKELVEEREQNRSKLRESHRALEEILAGRLPFHLVPKTLTDELRRQLNAEVKWFAWDAEKRSLEPRKFEFQSAFNGQAEPPIDPALSAEQQAAIKARLDAAWDTVGGN